MHNKQQTSGAETNLKMDLLLTLDHHHPQLAEISITSSDAPRTNHVYNMILIVAPEPHHIGGQEIAEQIQKSETIQKHTNQPPSHQHQHNPQEKQTVPRIRSLL